MNNNIIKRSLSVRYQHWEGPIKIINYWPEKSRNYSCDINILIKVLKLFFYTYPTKENFCRIVDIHKFQGSLSIIELWHNFFQYSFHINLLYFSERVKMSHLMFIYTYLLSSVQIFSFFAPLKNLLFIHYTSFLGRGLICTRSIGLQLKKKILYNSQEENIFQHCRVIILNLHQLKSYVHNRPSMLFQHNKTKYTWLRGCQFSKIMVGGTQKRTKKLFKKIMADKFFVFFFNFTKGLVVKFFCT